MRTNQLLNLALIFCLAFRPAGWPSGTRNSAGPAAREQAASNSTETGQGGLSVSSNEPDTATDGLIHLDVVVKDGSGKPVQGLELSDFRLLDNGLREKIVSFRSAAGANYQAASPLTVVLLIDALDAADLGKYERRQAAAFLRQMGGHLPFSVLIFSLEDSGFWLDAEPSLDGNALASAVEHGKRVALLSGSSESFQISNELPAAPDSLNPEYSQIPYVTALKAVGWIAAAERQKSGRKLLLWVGPGVGMGSGAYPDRRYTQAGTSYTPMDLACPPRMQNINSPTYVFACPEAEQNILDRIEWFSALLRESRLVIDAFAVGEDDPGSPRQPGYLIEGAAGPLIAPQMRDRWKAYLAGPQSGDQSNPMDLYKNVLAIQSGGEVLEPERTEDLSSQMGESLRDAGTFYELTFNPPAAAHPDERHNIEVEVTHPGLSAHTSAGYYDYPFYDDHGRDYGRSLQAITDRLGVPGPPGEQISADPPPSNAVQQQTLSSAVGYLQRTIPMLPDFFATRTTVQYGEISPGREAQQEQPEIPLHVVARSTASVLYRDGAEIVDVFSGKSRETDRALETYGTFGPLLSAVQSALNLSGAVTWHRWEQDPDGRRAVFNYVVSSAFSKYNVMGCCLPDGGGRRGFTVMPGYRGEIALDPATGAILRVELDADLQGFVPADRSDMMVSYGPVQIGGKTYILPMRSISMVRRRSVWDLWEWGEGFRTWGPYETSINVFTFTDYHMFRASSRILRGPPGR